MTEVMDNPDSDINANVGISDGEQCHDRQWQLLYLSSQELFCQWEQGSTDSLFRYQIQNLK